MSRELKFRIWDSISQKYLDESDEPVLEFMHEQDGIVLDYNNYSDERVYTIEQFTGLCDKNGKEIYEGDIVEYDFFEVKRFEVKFGTATEFNSDPYCPVEFVGWYAHETDDLEDWLHSGDIGKSVVIGNIHENGELLK